MSATLAGEPLSKLLDAPLLSSEGRQFPVEIKYIIPEKNLSIDKLVSDVVKKVIQNEEGDILVFLPGAGEIKRVKNILDEFFPSINILPLYGDLSQEKQNEAIFPDPHGIRKVVLATSIAETSLTIEGIKVVIDSGYSRVPRFDPRSGLTKLETVRVSKDSADQRAGRAGRLGPGVCYRIWAEATHQHLAANRTPEILEADLAPLLLELFNWGIKDIYSLTWLSPPPAGSMSQARDLLVLLGAIKDEKITEHGKKLAALPVHPRIGQMMLRAEQEGLTSLAIDIVSTLEEKDFLPKEAGAGLEVRINALRDWRKGEKTGLDRFSVERVERTASSWRKIFKCDENNQRADGRSIAKLLAAAYPERIAKKNYDGIYKLSNGRTARLKENDNLILDEWLVIAEMDAGSNEGKIFLAAGLDPKDVPELISESNILKWDSARGVIVARKEKRIGSIVVSAQDLNSYSTEEKNKVLINAVKEEGEKLFCWTDEIKSLQARVSSLRIWRKEEPWPDLTTEYLISFPEKWLLPYLDPVRKKEDFQNLDLENILKGILPWEVLQKLDELAPEKIKVPSGSLVPLQYSKEGDPPVLGVRLQEVFGFLETPAINEGKVKVIMHLLSPGYKPVQVTQDLKSFWKNTYPEVRKELRIKYSKHHWPEDPWTAEAVRGVKKISRR
jgi:ATP-dependent helicase HrpB